MLFVFLFCGEVEAGLLHGMGRLLKHVEFLT